MPPDSSIAEALPVKGASYAKFFQGYLPLIPHRFYLCESGFYGRFCFMRMHLTYTPVSRRGHNH